MTMLRFLMLVAFLPFAAAGAWAADAWQPVGSTETGFAAAMPGQPKMQKQTIGPHGESITLYLVQQGASAYSVAFTDLPAAGAADRDPEDVLNGVRDSSVRGLKGKLREEHPLTLAGRRGRDVLIDDPDGSVTHARYYLAPDRLYQVVAVVPRGEEEAPDVVRFLDSFKFKTP